MRARYLVSFMLAIAVSTSGSLNAVAQYEEKPRGAGQATIAVVSALVAPQKASGQPWDAGGPYVPFVPQVALPLEERIRMRLFHALTEVNPLEQVEGVLPWTRGTWTRGVAAPDVELYVLLNGQQLFHLPKVDDSFVPVWRSNYSPPFTFRPGTTLTIVARDKDLMSDDPIGSCVSTGFPVLEAQGYATSVSFQCSGQLWAVLVRVQML